MCFKSNLSKTAISRIKQGDTLFSLFFLWWKFASVHLLSDRVADGMEDVDEVEGHLTVNDTDILAVHLKCCESNVAANMTETKHNQTN